MAALSGSVSLSCSFNEVKDDVQRYLSQVEHNQLLEKKDKKELYLLFVNCLEVRAGPLNWCTFRSKRNQNQKFFCNSGHVSCVYDYFSN